jgi:hypothetical protein
VQEINIFLLNMWFHIRIEEDFRIIQEEEEEEEEREKW